MGFFDKFKKKEEDPFKDSSLNNNPYGDAHQDPFGHDLFNDKQDNTPSPNSQTDFPSSPTQDFPTQQTQNFQQPNQQYYEVVAPSRDVELILAKLDAIKAELDSVHQRVRKLESAHDAKHPQQKYW